MFRPCSNVSFQPSSCTRLMRLLHTMSFAQHTLCRPCRIALPFRDNLRSQRPTQPRRRKLSPIVRAGPLEGFVNELSKFINNSPLNEGKKTLAIKQAGDYDAAATRTRIDQLTSENAVLVFSWPTCPFCVKAKDLLTDIGADFQAIELNQGTTEGRAIRAELGQRWRFVRQPSWMAQSWKTKQIQHRLKCSSLQ